MSWLADARSRVGLALALAMLLAGCSQGAVPPAPVGPSRPPTAVKTPPPAYPEALACDGIGGTVQLLVRVGVDGRIGHVEMQRGSGNAQLDQAAAAAVRDWEFRPALQAGTPVERKIAVPMTFHAPVERPTRCFALDEQRR